ncbi:uncharacterized protein LOC131233808 isoform X2 [Magnolia sinica]|uniref:uncharacterized protein LOC131233808 isoform X2 n=1 Tax=Magnolia sinica TaxID=86752 RepID=UPI002659E3B9|nr:uncharacterized protein LOC131233808 isoform X2 [Magnolia sinica]XP_058086599.1 uncharacterized protein LOC131233808 isoform X2 [Magnolia sinica]
MPLTLSSEDTINGKRWFTTMLTMKILMQRSLASKSVRNLLRLKHAFYLHLGLNTMTLVEKRIAFSQVGQWNMMNKVRGLPCAHNFHVECIDEWLRLNVKCPRCRYSVFPNLDLSALSNLHANSGCPLLVF